MALDELIAKLGTVTEGNEELDKEFLNEVKSSLPHLEIESKPFTTSLSDVKKLLMSSRPRVLMVHSMKLENGKGSVDIRWENNEVENIQGETPALALCIAILRILFERNLGKKND